jgi:hypothetical protein
MQATNAPAIVSVLTGHPDVKTYYTKIRTLKIGIFV